jgi:hypothetical protein
MTKLESKDPSNNSILSILKYLASLLSGPESTTLKIIDNHHCIFSALTTLLPAYDSQTIFSTLTSPPITHWPPFNK